MNQERGVEDVRAAAGQDAEEAVTLGTEQIIQHLLGGLVQIGEVVHQENQAQRGIHGPQGLDQSGTKGQGILSLKGGIMPEFRGEAAGAGQGGEDFLTVRSVEEAVAQSGQMEQGVHGFMGIAFELQSHAGGGGPWFRQSQLGEQAGFARARFAAQIQ
ncbi:hypothetical protein DSECCO2_484860 [anaerobic digester metagenome]